MGSSPHTRGAQPCESSGGLSHRIIPAYAGSTAIFDQSLSVYEDHPRIRGEHAAPSESDKWDEGSSPHTRGAPLVDGIRQPLPRIIPAYAGSTSNKTFHGQHGADHPRIRGEHSRRAMCLSKAFGSSPHTRGAPLRALQGHVLYGIIPAYAGSTHSRRLIHDR